MRRIPATVHEANTCHRPCEANDPAHVKMITTKVSMSVGVTISCQLPVGVMLKFNYPLVNSHLTYALLAWGRFGRTNAAKIECSHRRTRKLLTDYNHQILIFTQFTITLLY